MNNRNNDIYVGVPMLSIQALDESRGASGGSNFWKMKTFADFKPSGAGAEPPAGQKSQNENTLDEILVLRCGG